MLFSFAFLSSCTLFTPHEEKEFLSWMRSTNQLYTGDEYHLRFGIFMTNARYVREFRSESFKVGLNKFAAMTPSEYNSLLGVIPTYAKDIEVSKSNVKVPETLDWREQGAVTDIKDQAKCGSCWAFSAIASVEGAMVVQGKKKLLRLSEQNLVDCCTKCMGCSGGFMTSAYNWVIDEQKGDLMLESDYSYTAVEGPCKFDATKAPGHLSGYVQVSGMKESDLIEKCAQYGPCCCAIDARQESFHLYESGIYDDLTCSKMTLNHGVVLVGWGIDNGKDYLIVRNSWGADWGEKGYIRFKKGVDQCGIATNSCVAKA